jgi:Putative MetA-pathway of phenol degradation
MLLQAMFAVSIRLTPAHAQPAAQSPAPAQSSAAQASADSEKLEPDRPDVTNGTHIVDAGLLQIEVGVLYDRFPASHNSSTPITFRLGLTDWMELRIGGDGLLSAVDAQTRQTGIGNTQISAKLRLWATPGGVPVLSILPTVNLPTASPEKGLGTGQADFTVTALTGSDFLTRAHADVNYGFGLIGADGGQPRFPQHLVSVSVSAEIPGPVSPYIETFWISRQDPDGGPVMAADAGAIYVITPRFALDGGIQWGLTDEAPSLAAFGGVSMIVGNILGDHGVHARHRGSGGFRRAH